MSHHNKGKTYVVFKGHTPGVYATWDEAKAQVDKFSNASHMSYKTREEREKAFSEYCQRINSQQFPSFSTSSYNTSSSTCPPSQVDDISLKYQLEMAIAERDHAWRVANIYANMCKEYASRKEGRD